MNSSTISIIIPVLNEAKHIASLLLALASRKKTACIAEIIVVDGGSIDETESIVNNTQTDIPIRWITAAKGRAKQLNMGASHAKGDILYFLHADTLPPEEYDRWIIDATARTDAGCFRLKFDSTHPILKFSEWFTRFNWRICRGGDQSLFIKKHCFQLLDGFDESYMVYEDCELIERIYDQFTFTVLPENVLTSARKYQDVGTLKLQYHFSVIHLKKRLGASPSDLHQYYKRHIAS